MAGAKINYEPVKLPLETRVLTLSPGNHNDPLVGTLSVLRIASPTEPYEALSYCWNSSVVTAEPPDPQSKIMAALYGTDESGNLVDQSEEIAFQDMLNHPHYESYYIRGGGKLPDGVLLLDGTPVNIGGELFRALRRLRDLEKPLRIWIDALCINQSDILERNEHVKTMGQIYANASHVRIWLGEAIGTESEFQHTLGAVNEALYNLLIKDGLLERGASVGEIQWMFVNSTQAAQIEWEKIAEFVDRAWFHRTWVIQEVANAREATIHVGPNEVSWEYLAEIVSMTRTYHLDYSIADSKGLKAVLMMRLLRAERMEPGTSHATFSFLTLLEELRGFQSTLPIDKLYGIVGLTEYKNKLTIDYSKSAEQAFTDFAIDQLHTGSLDILTHCVDVPSKPQTLSLPSWVPDWTRPGWVEPLRVRGLAANACGDTNKAPSFHIDPSHQTLTIKGRILDRIKAVEPAREIPRPPDSTGIPVGTTSDQTLQNMDPAHRHLQRMTRVRENARLMYTNILHLTFPDGVPDNSLTHPNPAYEPLWRAIMFNRTRDNAVPDAAVCARGFQVFLEGATSGEGPMAVVQNMAATEVREGRLSVEGVDQWAGELRKGYEDVKGAFSKWGYHRRFCTSQAGRLGWAVDGVKEGDVVVAFYGGKYPMVLREVQGGEGRWRIVGDCFLLGVMDGEGMEEEFQAGERDFVIV